MKAAGRETDLIAVDGVVEDLAGEELLARGIKVVLERLVAGLVAVGGGAAWAVDLEPVVVAPEDAVAVAHEDARDDGRVVEEARRRAHRFHEQLAVDDQQLAVLRLDTQARQLNVLRRFGVGSTHQRPILHHIDT